MTKASSSPKAQAAVSNPGHFTPAPAAMWHRRKETADGVEHGRDPSKDDSVQRTQKSALRTDNGGNDSNVINTNRTHRRGALANGCTRPRINCTQPINVLQKRITLRLRARP